MYIHFIIKSIYEHEPSLTKESKDSKLSLVNIHLAGVYDIISN